MLLKIGTINIKNTEENYDNKKVDIIINYIKKENFDILGMQEITTNLKKSIKKEYNVYGKPKYKLIGYLPFFRRWNEYNLILSNRKVTNVTTKTLFHEFKMKRIITYLKMNIDNKNLYIINTQLSYRSNYSEKQKRIQIKQLNQIIKLIKRIKSKDNNSYFILMGDFNMEIKLDRFKKFIEQLKFLEIKRINVDDKTNSEKYKNKTAIDHIFISEDIKLINYGLLNELKDINITDHNGIFAEIEI